MTTRERLTDALPLLGHRATGSSLPTRRTRHRPVPGSRPSLPTRPAKMCWRRFWRNWRERDTFGRLSIWMRNCRLSASPMPLA
jgi:hypothetical protein